MKVGDLVRVNDDWDIKKFKNVIGIVIKTENHSDAYDTIELVEVFWANHPEAKYSKTPGLYSIETLELIKVE